MFKAVTSEWMLAVEFNTTSGVIAEILKIPLFNIYLIEYRISGLAPIFNLAVVGVI